MTSTGDPGAQNTKRIVFQELLVVRLLPVLRDALKNPIESELQIHLNRLLGISQCATTRDAQGFNPRRFKKIRKVF